MHADTKNLAPRVFHPSSLVRELAVHPSKQVLRHFPEKPLYICFTENVPLIYALSQQPKQETTHTCQTLRSTPLAAQENRRRLLSSSLRPPNLFQHLVLVHAILLVSHALRPLPVALLVNLSDAIAISNTS